MFLKSADNLDFIYDQCTLQRGWKIKGIEGESKCRYCELKTLSSEKVQDQVLCFSPAPHLSIPPASPPSPPPHLFLSPFPLRRLHRVKKTVLILCYGSRPLFQAYPAPRIKCRSRPLIRTRFYPWFQSRFVGVCQVVEKVVEKVVYIYKPVEKVSNHTTTPCSTAQLPLSACI